MNLNTRIVNVGRLYKIASRKLEKLKIKTVEHLFFHIPFRYENYTIISKIGIIQPGEVVTIQGTVVSIKNEYRRRRLTIQKGVVADDTGEVECMWFNQPYIVKNIHKDDFVSIAGKVEAAHSKLVLQVKEYEGLNKGGKATVHTGRLVPVYPETRGLTSKWIRNRIKELLKQFQDELNEYIPDSITNRHNLIGFSTAIEQIHFPKDTEITTQARKRLAFDELFLTQLSSFYKRAEWEKERVTNFFHISSFREEIQNFWDKLPFDLTSAQEKVVKEVFSDLASVKPMNRLLQGDVGSGKTVVATIAMYIAHLNKFQSVLMAPTEILAEQHYQTVSKLLSPLGVKVGLITSNRKLSTLNSQPRSNRGQLSILVGTHALLSQNIKFDKLGLVVIDEQQRFGVEQRSLLRKKGNNPHVLILSATPIPRTVYLTLFGDLDLSCLDEMPKGRKLVKTWLVPQQRRMAAYEWIKKKINDINQDGQKNQVFIICPFIEESETILSVKSAKKEFDLLSREVFKDFRVGLLHGKMKGKEKNEVLEKFKNGKLDILVATPVVEVGIDISSATIIVIEGSERFGLASLHQLRGRVGRGSRESFCLLFTESKSPKTLSKLKLLETTHNGAKLAELDLTLRGPGEVYGTMQHGSTELKIASYSDFELIEKARIEVESIFPKLNEYPKLIEKIRNYRVENVSPD